jgi:putative hemolysin
MLHRHVALLALLLAAACTKPDTATSTTPGAPTTGTNTQLANPASTNCVDKGGKLEIVNGPGGEQGICTLADGTQCEEWAYMRGECPAAAPGKETAPAPTPGKETAPAPAPH